MKTVFDIYLLILDACVFGRALNGCARVGTHARGVCCYMNELAIDMVWKGEY